LERSKRITDDEEFRILRRAADGDEEVLPKLRELLDRSPAVRDHFLDGELTIASFAEKSVLGLSCAKKPVGS
jgi:hypothetical protein